MTNINLTLPDDLLAAIDRERGDVPRVRWIRRAIEQRLEHNIAWGVEEFPSRVYLSSEQLAEATGLPVGSIERQAQRLAKSIRSSQQVKADVQSRPKGGK